MRGWVIVGLRHGDGRRVRGWKAEDTDGDVQAGRAALAAVSEVVLCCQVIPFRLCRGWWWWLGVDDLLHPMAKG
jgi:hypothetical protein